MGEMGDIAWTVASNICFMISCSLYFAFCESSRSPLEATEQCIGYIGCYASSSLCFLGWKSSMENYQGLRINDMVKSIIKLSAGVAGVIIDSSFPADKSLYSLLVSIFFGLTIICANQVIKPTQEMGFLDMALTMVATKGYAFLCCSPTALAVPILYIIMVAGHITLQKYWVTTN